MFAVIKSEYSDTFILFVSFSLLLYTYKENKQFVLNLTVCPETSGRRASL